MKFLGNPAKIGDAALLIYFPSKREERWQTRTSLHKEDADLQKIDLDWQKVNTLYMWGIGTGLVKIEILRYKFGSALDFISRQIKTEQDLEKFSHFVVIRGCISSETPRDLTTVDIYRLTQSNKKLININWSWIKLEDEN
jgi:hypothetical protein